MVQLDPKHFLQISMGCFYYCIPGHISTILSQRNCGHQHQQFIQVSISPTCYARLFRTYILGLHFLPQEHSLKSRASNVGEIDHSTTIEWKREDAMTYPNLTVCFAKFFVKKRMEGKT
jgi:hypothetical protein